MKHRRFILPYFLVLAAMAALCVFALGQLSAAQDEYSVSRARSA